MYIIDFIYTKEDELVRVVQCGLWHIYSLALIAIITLVRRPEYSKRKNKKLAKSKVMYNITTYIEKLHRSRAVNVNLVA